MYNSFKEMMLALKLHGPEVHLRTIALYKVGLMLYIMMFWPEPKVREDLLNNVLMVTYFAL